jgi:chromosome segregation ATPase
MNNKVKLLAVLIGFLVFSESAGIIYFANKAQEFSKKFNKLEPNYEKLNQEQKELKDKYDVSVKENEAIKADRSNLLAQAKVLIADNSRMGELEEEISKLETEKQDMLKNKEDMNGQNQKLQEVVKQLMNSQAQTAQERDSFKASYEKARKEDIVKEMKKQVADLQKEKDRLSSELVNIQKKSELLAAQKAKLDKDKESLENELKDYKKDVAEATKKNKALQQQIENAPKKFSEIARQNKKLLKETAGMHYNLGVFYTKNKEYNRAVAEFEKAVELNPDDSYSHFNLGCIYSEYMVNRKKAIENFRHFLRLAKGDDQDADMARKYILTWETYEGKTPMN